MGSKDADRHLMDGGDEGVEAPDSGVSCSICLDLVTDNGGRSRAKLQCGHEFHLDCIGSAFNMKGAMQCPNCRKVEKGQWLYANGSTHSFPEFSIDEWIPDEDPYDLNYPEMPFRVHWCPFGRLAGIHSSFEEVETPPTYHDQRGNHAIFAEHTAATSAAHSYVAYFRPITPASSNSNDGINDFNHQWNGPSGHNENLNRHNFPAIDIQYHSWIHHFLPFSPISSHINSADRNSVPPGMLRSIRGESDGVTRSRSFLHPLSFGHRSGHRTGSSFVPSIVPRHPGSNARTHERIQNSHGFWHQQPSSSPAMPTSIIPGIRRLDGSRGLPPVVPAPSQTDHPGGFYILPPSSSSGRTPHEAENSPQNPLQILSFNRELSGRLYHQSTGGSDSGNRPTDHWHRHWS